MLWFILGVIQFFCFGYGNVMLVSFKQKKTKFKPKIKLNYNIHKRKQGWLLRMLLKQGTGNEYGEQNRELENSGNRARVQVRFC